MSSTALASPVPTGMDVTETAAAAVAAQAKAAVEARYLVALQRPRNWLDVRNRLLDACKRPGFAETARYAKPVGGKKVTGLSVRFAEEAARAMTNVLNETTVVFDDDERRIVRVSSTDLEANVSYPTDVILDKTVERRQAKEGDEVLGSRSNSTGQTVYRLRATEDDLLTKQNALVSKAMRNNVLRILPGDLQEECEQQIIATLRDRDAKDPDAARKKVADSFYSLGVSAAELDRFLGHPLSQINEAEMGLLRTIYTAIKEGETTWTAVLAQKEAESGAAGPESPTKAGTQGLKDRVRKAGGPMEAATEALGRKIEQKREESAQGQSAATPSQDDLAFDQQLAREDH